MIYATASKVRITTIQPWVYRSDDIWLILVPSRRHRANQGPSLMKAYSAFLRIPTASAFPNRTSTGRHGPEVVSLGTTSLHPTCLRTTTRCGSSAVYLQSERSVLYRQGLAVFASARLCLCRDPRPQLASVLKWVRMRIHSYTASSLVSICLFLLVVLLHGAPWSCRAFGGQWPS